MNFIIESFQCAIFKATTYPKINGDPSWLIKSISIVSIAALAIAATVFFDPSEDLEQILAEAGTTHLYYASICLVSTFLGWVIWSITTHFVGIRLYFVRQKELSRHVTYRLTLRTTGFAYVPGISALMLLAPFSVQWEKMICMLIWIWVLAVATIGTKTLHECGTIRALNSTIPGWFIAGVILLMFMYP